MSRFHAHSRPCLVRTFSSGSAREPTIVHNHHANCFSSDLQSLFLLGLGLAVSLSPPSKHLLLLRHIIGHTPTTSFKASTPLYLMLGGVQQGLNSARASSTSIHLRPYGAVTDHLGGGKQKENRLLLKREPTLSFFLRGGQSKLALTMFAALTSFHLSLSIPPLTTIPLCNDCECGAQLYPSNVPCARRLYLHQVITLVGVNSDRRTPAEGRGLGEAG